MNALSPAISGEKHFLGVRRRAARVTLPSPSGLLRARLMKSSKAYTL